MSPYAPGLQAHLPSPLVDVKDSKGKVLGTEHTLSATWPGKNALQSRCYKASLAAVSDKLDELAIRSKSKTHMYRKAGARRIDDAGAEDSVSLSTAKMSVVRGGPSISCDTWRLNVDSVRVILLITPSYVQYSHSVGRGWLWK